MATRMRPIDLGNMEKSQITQKNLNKIARILLTESNPQTKESQLFSSCMLITTEIWKDLSKQIFVTPVGLSQLKEPLSEMLTNEGPKAIAKHIAQRLAHLDRETQVHLAQKLLKNNKAENKKNPLNIEDLIGENNLDTKIITTYKGVCD